MSNNKEDTKREHFIPRFYFKGFSDDGVHIYQNHIDDICFDKYVPFNTICYKENLYEFIEENGKITNRNHIENIMSNIEGKVSTVIKEIERKSNDESYFYSTGFLSEKEEGLLIIFSVLQIIRLPDTIKIFTEIIKDMSFVIPDKVARAIALLKSFPAFEYNPEDDKNFFNKMIQMFYNMHIQILKSYSESFITCDVPCIMYLYDDNRRYTQAKKIVFPLTSDLLLLMDADMHENERNTIIKCPAERVRSFNKIMINTAHNWVYSKEKLTPQMKKWIKKKQRKDTKLADADNND